ncbi:periplasmic repressor CpxP [Vibrio zhanjiangensis]|uniref:Periplasmic repressor CpxP n=1 Tax=Vibrio zhanjiangensis TaxID=1046128 RepID=A0ABQ6EZM0_9VIBR|nr:CpxP family protein [Vibrio zhanjiangensis]GLT17907.1 periplasmic repressor CpxP [Vibrio zhanjiangensis]
MKTVTKLVLATIVLPLSLTSVSAYANSGKGHGKPEHKEFAVDPSLMRELDLSPEQQTQLKELRNTMKNGLKAQRQENFAAHQAEMQANREKMQALLLAESFDKSAADELVRAMLDKQAEHKVMLLEKQHQMLSILTPQQKAKYVELQKERDEKRAQKRHERLTKN